MAPYKQACPMCGSPNAQLTKQYAGTITTNVPSNEVPKDGTKVSPFVVTCVGTTMSLSYVRDCIIHLCPVCKHTWVSLAYHYNIDTVSKDILL